MHAEEGGLPSWEYSYVQVTNNLKVLEGLHTKSLFLNHMIDPTAGERDVRMGENLLRTVTRGFRLPEIPLFCSCTIWDP